MTFNLAQAHAQLLSRLCIKYNKYLQYIRNDFSEFNGCFKETKSATMNIFRKIFFSF